ncbi:MAG TPA: acetate--CoA ligase [Vicinamibacterales bacterium]|nr:acetate--CoA ligase [Vicinamibacterales bacterium]
MNLVPPVVQTMIDDARRDPDTFWDRAARQLHWFRAWDRVFDDAAGRPVASDSAFQPAFRWFAGGHTNLCYNALDHHVAQGRGDHTALIYFNERGEQRRFTYTSLLHDVERVAAALRALGIDKGDRVTVYMPTSPEAITLMLAIVRVGAIHSVVFAGFGARALSDRIVASGSRLVVTADVTYRKGKTVALKAIVDEAVQLAPNAVEHVVVLRREGPAEAGHDREIDWNSFLTRGDGHSAAHVEMEANEPAYILATSGTTAKPKLAVHTHGGYQVHIASMGRWCFGLKSPDVWWTTSDIGWIVGHSYMIYAPLIAGCTTVAFEGALDHPGPEVNWRTAIEEFGVTGMFTSPTAVRMLMRYGEDTLTAVDHSRLERIVCAGEVLNPHAWDWLQNHVLGGRVPVLDHMWQTETGGPAFGNPYGVELMPIKPGSATIPLPGIEANVVTMTGEPCAPDEKGIMVLTRPFPGMTPALWGERERYQHDYWQKIPGVYYSGDSTYIDEDGYFWFCGRADEVIKIAAHRIGTIEVESAFITHPAVAECGVVGRPDDTRGEVISAFVVLKNGYAPSAELREALLQTVRKELGAVAVIGELNFVAMLPKTRSGKIMRRVLKAVVLDVDPGDITTIEDEGSVEEARQAWEELKGLRAQAQGPGAGQGKDTSSLAPYS